MTPRSAGFTGFERACISRSRRRMAGLGLPLSSKRSPSVVRARPLACNTSETLALPERPRNSVTNSRTVRVAVLARIGRDQALEPGARRTSAAEVGSLGPHLRQSGSSAG